MKNFSGPKDVYEDLVENVPEYEDWLLGLVAFAVIEEQKIEWMKHWTQNNGNLPLPQDIDNWYQQLTSGVLLRAKDTAESRLTDFAADAVSDFVDETQDKARREAEEGIIVSEIRALKKFWPQFGLNIIGGFAGALLLAALLGIFSFLMYNDISPIDIGKKLGHQLDQEVLSEKPEVIDNE